MNGTAEDAERHRAKMANRKSAQDAEVAKKTIEKGLLIVHTGKGKGKSTAALGLLLRALGRGMRAGVVQFGKGSWDTGERTAVDASAIRSCGTRWARASPGRRRTARATSPRPSAPGTKAEELMADPSIRLLILDELNISLRYDHLALGEVVATLRRGARISTLSSPGATRSPS